MFLCQSSLKLALADGDGCSAMHQLITGCYLKLLFLGQGLEQVHIGLLHFRKGVGEAEGLQLAENFTLQIVACTKYWFLFHL